MIYRFFMRFLILAFSFMYCIYRYFTYFLRSLLLLVSSLLISSVVKEIKLDSKRFNLMLIKLLNAYQSKRLQATNLI